ncbi:mitochondrial glyco protein [Hyaloscypha bicolor E]|uniref:Mitochondrial glyco protein n=1 Tax=Hyaloscypha bicolor E TaxID=1095630 RepID=A0A2J6TW93_9HELO|nr:mitochondrial glyco protein [Hyaloscypha bicolor E]PMD67277.1 mitochondrial glyco protein [Hyaloscypha bicolor E]
MLSIRSFARAVPRTASRLTASAFRTPSARPASLLQSAWIPARTQYAAAFSTTTIRPSKSGEGDDELVAKLESEIQMENEMSDEGGIPTSVKDYLENGPFEILDTPGQEEVVLTRQFGDETIKVTFSIADLNQLDPEADFQDPAMGDEEDNINQGDEKNFKVAPEDQIEEQDGEGEEEQEQSFPARLNIVVEKAGKGALAVEAVVQEGMVVIDNVFYYTDASHAYGKTADKVHERQDLYVGPPFSNLDEDLQVLLERYLDERGINAALALFVPDYIDMKEQKEYLRWLENVKGFVEA